MKHMLMRQMELFVQAAEAGSMSKAASQALLSVAAVSQQISALEREIGAPLLRRTNHGAQLTELGELFYVDAKAILSHTQQAMRRAKERAVDTRRLVIGGYGSDSHHVLPAVFLAVMEKYPQALVSVRPIDFGAVEEELLSSNVDICFVYGQNELSIRSPLLRYSQVFEDKLCLSVPVHSKLARKERVEFSDLRGEHLVIIRRGFSTLHDRVREYIEQNEPEILVSDCTENSVENACRLHTIECSYMVPALFEAEDPTRTLRQFGFAEKIPIGVIYRKASTPFITRQVIPLCCKVVAELAANKQ